MQALLFEVKLCLLLKSSAAVISDVEVDCSGLTLIFWHVRNIVHRGAFDMTRWRRNKTLFMT